MSIGGALWPDDGAHQGPSARSQPAIGRTAPHQPSFPPGCAAISRPAAVGRPLDLGLSAFRAPIAAPFLPPPALDAGESGSIRKPTPTDDGAVLWAVSFRASGRQSQKGDGCPTVGMRHAADARPDHGSHRTGAYPQRLRRSRAKRTGMLRRSEYARRRLGRRQADGAT